MLKKCKELVSRYKKHFLDMILIVATSFISKMVSLLVLMYVARSIGGVDFGKYQTLLVTLTLFSSAIQGSLSLYATKFIASTELQGEGSVSQVVWTSYIGAIVLGFVTFGLAFGSANWLAISWLGDTALAPLIKLAAVTLIFGPLAGVQSGILAGSSNYRTSALLSAAAPLFSAPVFIYLSLHYGVDGTVAALMLQSLIACLMGEFLIVRTGLRGRKTLKLHLLGQNLKEFIRFCAPTSISGFVIAPANWYATVLIVALPNGYLEMAAYGVANQWKQAILFIPTALSSYVTSHLSRSSNDRDRYDRVFKISVAVAMSSGLLSAMLICLLSTYIMKQYLIELNEGWLVLCVASVSAAIVSVNNMYSRSAASLGRAWLFLGYEVIWAFSFIVMSIVVVERYGSLGVAIAALLAAGVQLFFQVFVWNALKSRK